MLATWTWVITIFLSLFFIGMSLRFRKKSSESFLQFAIAGGTLPFFLILFTDIATIMGVGNFVGHSSKGFEAGVANIPFIIGEQGSKILFALLFAGFAARFTYKSIAELLNDLILRDKVSRAIVGILTSAIMIAWIGGQAKGMGALFSVFTGADPLPLIFFFSTVFIIYTTVGGMLSVVWTDFVQGVLLLALAVWFYIKVYAKVDFSYSKLQTMLADVGASHLTELSISGWEVLNLFITGCFGILAAQVYWQRSFAAENPKAASRAMLYSGFVAIIFTILASVSGMIVKAINPDVEAGNAISWLILNEMTQLVALLFFILIFLAAISSASSQLHSAAIVIVNDLIIPFSKEIKDQKLIVISKWLVVLVGIFSILAAIYSESIISLFSFAYTMTGGGVVPVLIIGLLWKKRKTEKFEMGSQNSKVSVWGGRIGLLSGAIVSVVFGILWGVFVSAILTIIVSLLLPNRTNRIEHA
ncbi:Na+/proline symporter [Ureibacillus xyleni]|uniref:Na+/proline symporter n=1 Tax=Ureibacillus xyleni TaxID=614648 RepID=A0A285S7C4_9BACL|nr:sodium:solute symporter family protein [Ureibacillus xyleni]SOC02993.1 Na+/proline symporter [Ureibacillus xyleni]